MITETIKITNELLIISNVPYGKISIDGADMYRV